MDGSRTTINDAIDYMRYDQESSWTYTDEAIYYAWDNIQQYGRTDVTQVQILMTDGASTFGLYLYDDTTGDYTYPAVNLIHGYNITSFAIGIGAGTSSAELNEIATDPDEEFVYDIDSYSNLNDIYMKITNAVCQEVNSDSGLRSLPRATPNLRRIMNDSQKVPVTRKESLIPRVQPDGEPM